MKKLVINSPKCNACGACALDCALLNEKSDGTVYVVEPGFIKMQLLPKVEEIVKYCPTQALNIIDVDGGIDIHKLKDDMNKPVEVEKPDYESYSFNLEDRDEYLDELPNIYCDGEDRYDYKSDSSAVSAGKAAFRDEVYSQAEAFIEKVLVLYNQRKINSVARYAEVDGNIKYEAHKKLINRLKSYVHQIEIYTGKNINLDNDFYKFYTKDTDYIDEIQEQPNSWAIDRIKEYLESASHYYDYIKVDSIETYVEVKKFFGGTDYKYVKRYSYNLDRATKKFKKEIGRKTWKYGRYTKEFAVAELDGFRRELQTEWNGKIEILLGFL
jgi:ferredoxin